MFHRLCHDLELKKQIVAICLIAAIVMAMETFLFFGIITPQIVDNLAWMLRRDQPVLGQDPVIQAMTRCLLRVAHERELELLRNTNQAALLHAILIGASSLLLVLSLYAFSGPLRRAPWRNIWVDVGVTASCIVVFQVVFYFFGQRWRYADASAMLQSVCKRYNEVSKDTNAAVSCDPCMDKVQNVLNRSPTYVRLKAIADEPNAILNDDTKQLLDLLGVSIPPTPGGMGAFQFQAPFNSSS
jgi:hypothetical protein